MKIRPKGERMTLEEIKQLVAEKRYQYSQKVRDFIEEGFFDEVDLMFILEALF